MSGIQITLDAFGRAVEQSNSGTYSEMVYSPSGQKFALMHGQSVQWYFVPLAAGATAVYNATDLQYYRHADWLGSSWLAVNTNGSTYGDQAYAPFGESYAGAGNALAVFTGQTKDTIGGDYDFLFRQYAPGQGRWLVPDPAGMAAVDITNPQTWNRYAYVANNPLNAIDPLGLYIQDCMWDGCGFSGAGGGDGGMIGGGGYGGDSGFSTGTYFGPSSSNLANYQAAADAWSPYAVQASGYSTNGAAYQINDQGQWYNTSSGDELSQSSVAELGLPDPSPFASSPVQSQGYGLFSQNKGERGLTGSANASKNPTKKARPRRDGNGKIIGWEVKDPVTGKMIPKSLDWGKANGLDPKSFAVGAAGAVGWSIIMELLEGLGEAGFAF